MKVSILVPLYNVEKYIGRCIESIQAQTIEDFEVIIVNDGSIDNSAAIVKQYMVDDSRIELLENPKNMGLMWTRKVAYTKAEGDYILFCDSDDELTPNALEVLLDAAIEQKADIVVSSYTTISLHENERIYSPKLLYGNDSTSVFKSLLRSELVHSLWAKLYTRHLFDDNLINFENMTNGEDAVLFYQLVDRAKRIVAITESTYKYYMVETSSTNSVFTPNKLRNLGVSWNFLENIFIAKSEVKSDYEKAMVNRFYSASSKNYNVSIIVEACGQELFDRYTAFGMIRKYYSLPKSVGMYLMMHNRLTKSLYAVLSFMKRSIIK